MRHGRKGAFLLFALFGFVFKMRDIGVRRKDKTDAAGANPGMREDGAQRGRAGKDAGRPLGLAVRG